MLILADNSVHPSPGHFANTVNQVDPKTGTLTDAGRMLQNYGQRLVRLAEEAESAMRELRDLRRGRVLSESEVNAARKVAVINQTLVSRYFGAEMSRRLHLG